MQESLYVLELEGGKRYVGKSADVAKRFEQHKSGSGSAWTRLHKPIRILETRPLTSIHDETNVTKDLMKKYGVDNVRGGAYTAVDLPEEQEDMIRHEMRSASDACYKCGKPGHFANKCTRKSSFKGTCGCGRSFLDFNEFLSHNRACIRRTQEEESSDEELSCTRCGRDGHERSSCYAKTHDNGYSLSSPKKQTTSQSGKCYRCGRAGHYSPDCYASTHVRGYDLDD
jgi:predicted GIY-YIG superfamily endonuclease